MTMRAKLRPTKFSCYWQHWDNFEIKDPTKNQLLKQSFYFQSGFGYSLHAQPWFASFPRCPLSFKAKLEICWARPKNQAAVKPWGRSIQTQSFRTKRRLPHSRDTSLQSHSQGEMTHQWISSRTGAHSLPWKQVRGHVAEGIVSVERFQEQQFPGWETEGEKSGMFWISPTQQAEDATPSTCRCSGHTVVCRNKSVTPFTETKPCGEEWWLCGAVSSLIPTGFYPWLPPATPTWASQTGKPSLKSEGCSTNLQMLPVHPTMVLFRALMGLIPASTTIPSWSCWTLPPIPLTDVHEHNNTWRRESEGKSIPGIIQSA